MNGSGFRRCTDGSRHQLTGDLSHDSDRFAPWVIGGISFAVLGAIAFVLSGTGHAPRDDGPSRLASLNAALNATSATLLTAGYAAIRRRNVAVHRACMVAAFVASSLFLVCYLVHHATAGSVPFRPQPPWIRSVYFAVLIPHVVLSAVVLPLALTTIYLAWGGRFAVHARVARWTLPIWLWVSVSGVVVYWMLYHLA